MRRASTAAIDGIAPALRGGAMALMLLALAAGARADAGEAGGSGLLRSENGSVRAGNAKLKAGDAKAALGEYDRAARELPAEGGVHLNRGLALLKTGDLVAAREALRLATQPPASKAVRADAYYDLGNTFYKEADASAGKNEHEPAQKAFRDAAEAFKQSLRLRPGDKNTAWNYELAVRRIREQEQKQKEQEQKQDQQKQDEPKQDQQKQDEQKQDEQQQDQQQQDQQQQDQAQQDQPKQDQPKQDQQEPQQDQAQQQPQQQPQQDEAQAKPEQPVPREVERALDALEEGEDNLERLRAMRRAARERRVPEKDW
jgi:Ca-activated chloride channel family protein